MTATAVPRPQPAPSPGRSSSSASLRADSTAALLAAAALIVTGGAPSVAASAGSHVRSLPTSASGTWVVVTAPGRSRAVATAVVASGGVVERALPTLDTLVVAHVSPRALGRAPGWCR